MVVGFGRSPRKYEVVGDGDGREDDVSSLVAEVEGWKQADKGEEPPRL